MDGAYSFSLTTFSPSGKLGQIEHALAAVASGKPALGIRCKDGVILATEKKFQSSLVDQESIRKVDVISGSIGAVYAGVAPDYRIILKRARKTAQAYYNTYREQMPVRQLVRDVASLMQEFTQSGGVRPFGVSLMIAGVDDNGPQLYQVDPSGAYFGWKASAIGKNFANSKTFLERRYTDEMEVEDAIHTAILTLKETFEGAMDEHNVEIGVINNSDRTFRVLSPSQVRDYLSEIE